MTRVVVHIDKLVLRGIDRADAPAVSAGIRSQLKALLVELNVAATLVTGGDRYRIEAGSAQFDQSRDAGELGRSIGKRIARKVIS